MSRIDPDEFEAASYQVDDGVATLRMERPGKKNAIDARLRDEMVAAVDRFEDDGDAKVLVIAGSGDSFSAGADVNELRDRLEDQAELSDLGDALDYDRYQLMSERVESAEKPVVAMINGYCLGGGFELALACDIRIAARDAEFATPEMNLGKFPGDGATQRLPQVANAGHALFLVLTGEHVDAERAYDYGILQEVVDPDDLEERTMEVAETIADQPAASLVLGKQVVGLADRTEFETGLELEALLSRFLELTPERRERVEEFLSD